MTLNEIIQKADSLGILTEIQNETPEQGRLLIEKREKRNTLVAAYEKIEAVLLALQDFPHLSVERTRPDYQLIDAVPTPEEVGRFKAHLGRASINLTCTLHYEHGWDAAAGCELGDPFADELTALPAPSVAERNREAAAAIARRPMPKVICTHGDPCLCADDQDDWHEELVEDTCRGCGAPHSTCTCGECCSCGVAPGEAPNPNCSDEAGCAHYRALALA